MLPSGASGGENKTKSRSGFAFVMEQHTQIPVAPFLPELPVLRVSCACHQILMSLLMNGPDLHRCLKK